MKSVCLLCCERVLSDLKGPISLISVMQKIELSSLPGIGLAIPSDAVGPTAWAIFAVWQPDDDERNREFTQWFQILWPDGKEFAKSPLKFITGEFGYSQNFLSINAMPFGQRGKVAVRSWIEENGKPITETSEYTIDVEHKFVSLEGGMPTT